jgi:hypothetical protein
MGRRQRQRDRGAERSLEALQAPSTDYTDDDGNVLTLRGSMTPATRREYAKLSERSNAAASREDVWQRTVEFLFERLAVRWVIAALPIDGQRELLARLRAASPAERAWVRDVLRRHCAENFPELATP